jgi:hypothetical protein
VSYTIEKRFRAVLTAEPDYKKKGNLSMPFFDNHRFQASSQIHNLINKPNNLPASHNTKSTLLSSIPPNKPS